MLLPSALPCDSPLEQQRSAHGRPRLHTGLFASPPASPPTLSSHNAFGSIVSSCRSLQSLITTVPAEELPSLNQLPTPPLAHAPPPLKLRLRSRANKSEHKDERTTQRKRIAKRTPPRGVNKRRRGADDDDDDRYSDEEIDSDLDLGNQSDSEMQKQPIAPSTPKRARIAPEQLPLGLERSDFHEMHLRDGTNSSLEERTKPGTGVEIEADGEEWSAEDDRVLVELVLEKLKLSKNEWQDCARSLGKDRQSGGRRWKSLMGHGDVGIKTRSSNRRTKLHATWR